MPICHRCNNDLPIGNFALNTGRGRPRRNLCRICVNEQAKQSIRERKSLPRYLAQCAKWPVETLVREQVWLEQKLAAVREELARRK